MDNNLQSRLLGKSTGEYSILQSRRIAQQKQAIDSYASNSGWHNFQFMLDPTCATLSGEVESPQQAVEANFDRQLFLTKRKSAA